MSEADISKATARPWQVEPQAVRHPKGPTIAWCPTGVTLGAGIRIDHTEATANAELIARAVNSYDAMLVALQELLPANTALAQQASVWRPIVERAEAAIRLAEGREQAP